MLVRCWGVRGSIPVSGPEYTRYGGATTCIEVRTATDDVIAIDAGSGIRRFGNSLMQEQKKQITMLFTHSHWDHIIGFPFFKPVYSSDVFITVYGCSMEGGGMESLIDGLMRPPYFPVPLSGLQANIDWKQACSDDKATQLYGVTVDTIALSHPNNGLGYKFTENGKTFAFLTDNELTCEHPGGKTFEEYVAFCSGADVLLHDAEFTDEEYTRTKGWGHSTWKSALELAIQAQVSRFGLFHHNQDRTDEALDAIVAECRSILAERGIKMKCFAARQGMEIQL